jgi:Mg/Co/Ni transporter MgtE
VKQADILEALMRKQCETSNIPLDLPQKRPREEPKPEHIPEIVTLNAKLDFADKIKKVGHEILFDIVKNIESDCKQALEELDPDRIQIKVDSLDKQTFDKLMNLVDSAIDESRPHKYSNNKSNKKF